MTETLRIMPWNGADENIEPLVTREWLVTNGLGGYASGTIAGAATRRYHGLLIAAMPAPLGRMMMLNHLSEQFRLADGTVISLSGEERVPKKLQVPGAKYLTEFRLETGLPVWRYRIRDLLIEKRVFLPRFENTVHIVFRLLEGEETLRLKLLPSVHFRSHDAPVSSVLHPKFELKSTDDRMELSAGPELPTLRLAYHGHRPAFTIERKLMHEMLYRIEEDRGYDSVGDLWSPGYFRFDLSKRHAAVVTASTEAWDKVLAVSPSDALVQEIDRRAKLIHAAPPTARSGVGAELVLAADQFIIRPVRPEGGDESKPEAEDAHTVIAGYHWFTDWGRDTMISLEGLTLSTGRAREGGYILRTFAKHIRDGLIPNMFPEGENQGLYHTADATMWFFHAVDRYLQATGDRALLQEILPHLLDIYDKHIDGTRFNIGVDPKDGLLRQGEKGYQLTWMDAKLGDWVVTPRRGKAVEINALWYNAIKLLERWVTQEHGAAEAADLTKQAEQTRASFNTRFWNAKSNQLFDVVDGENGDDPASRPNQIFAVSLPNPVLDDSRWSAIVTVVQEQLLTPVGLRSLAPSDPEYKPTYHGDLRTRDAAYHQGTVWAWLIGPFIDAWMKVNPNRHDQARELLGGLVNHLDDACIGSVSEVFDAEHPFTARGCCAQAWSVAEFLRCWSKTTIDDAHR